MIGEANRMGKKGEMGRWIKDEARTWPWGNDKFMALAQDVADAQSLEVAKSVLFNGPMDRVVQCNFLMG